MKKAVVLLCVLLLPMAVGAQRFFRLTTTSDRSRSLLMETGKTAKAPGTAHIVTLHRDCRHQSIDGFGYALTYSTCYNLLRMAPEARHRFLLQTFSDTEGYGVSYVRMSIGCNDFSSTEYTLCDRKGLENFALQRDETQFVLPILKEVLAINPAVKIIAAPWTCPRWMKVTDPVSRRPHYSWTDGRLNPDYRGTYARYFVKFVEAMKREGFDVYAVSPQNEPLNKGNCASTYMPWEDEAPLVKEMAAAFKKAGLKTRIYVFDHNYNYDNMPSQAGYPVKVYTALGSSYEGSELVAGAAYHNYGGTESELDNIRMQAPGKELIFTETSIGTWNNGHSLQERLNDDMEHVVLGTVNRMCRAVMVWNLMLDTKRGPNLDGGCQTCFGAVDIDKADYSHITYNSHYYVISHIAAMVKPGAYRVETNGWQPFGLTFAGFVNPDGSMAVVLSNSNDDDLTLTVTDGSEYMDVTVPARGVVSARMGSFVQPVIDGYNSHAGYVSTPISKPVKIKTIKEKS